MSDVDQMINRLTDRREQMTYAGSKPYVELDVSMIQEIVGMLRRLKRLELESRPYVTGKEKGQ